MFPRESRVFLFTFAVFLILFPQSSVAAGKANVVLITLESTRADRVGFLGSKSRLTPALDGLAHQSIVFEQAYTQAPLTVASHATILSGTYPQTNHASELGTPLPPSLPFLPELLHSRGYHTAAFVGSIELDPRNGFAPGFDRGFDLYDAAFAPEPVVGRPPSIAHRGSEVVARAVMWLAANTGTPFFLWIQLDDPDLSTRTSYNSAITAADAAAGKLIAALRARHLYDDSLIVLAADHGDSLGAHGEETYGMFLYDETVRVPLLLKLPQNQSGGKVVRTRVGLVDLAPTVLEVAGVPVPSQMQGQSLLRIARGNSNADQPAYSRTDFPQKAFGWSALESWRAGKYLYIRAPTPELYDLSSDPGATRNLAQRSKATLDTIASQLLAFDQHFNSNSDSINNTSLTSSEMQKLASLGYVGLEKSSTVNAAASGTDPKDEIAAANKVLAASTLLEQGKAEKALALLQPLPTALSDSYLANYVLGAALARRQQYPKAIDHLHRATELQPDAAWAHYDMGLSLLKTGDFKTAAVHLEIAATRLPGFASAHSLLALAYDHTGRTDDAKREQAIAAKLGARP
jgi:arylsulfatase A-like enzyme/Flp pilus assembly protein TadD